jgi:hypothetical protein
VANRVSMDQPKWDLVDIWKHYFYLHTSRFSFFIVKSRADEWIPTKSSRLGVKCS